MFEPPRIFRGKMLCTMDVAKQYVLEIRAYLKRNKQAIMIHPYLRLLLIHGPRTASIVDWQLLLHTFESPCGNYKL